VLQAPFTFSATVYLLIYAFEGALPYGLYNVGMDSVILLRDGLLTVPLAVLLVTQAFRLRVHPALFVFAGIIALHGTIATLDLPIAVISTWSTSCRRPWCARRAVTKRCSGRRNRFTTGRGRMPNMVRSRADATSRRSSRGGRSAETRAAVALRRAPLPGPRSARRSECRRSA
jgi:hypothetical protein